MISAESRTLASTQTQTLWRILVEAAVVILAGAVIALAFNALRPGHLPLVARTPYQTLVPCPEPGGPVEALDAGSPEVFSPRSFLIDARTAAS